MSQRFLRKLFCSALLLGLVCAGLPVTEVQAEPATTQPSKQGQKPNSLTAREAAARAKAKHGGKVLKVIPKGSAYRVKLLTDSGRVVTVTVRD